MSVRIRNREVDRTVSEEANASLASESIKERKRES
jgi:hypothetical protein